MAGERQALLGRAGEVRTIAHGYGGEVIFGLVGLGVPFARRSAARDANAFFDAAQAGKSTIGRQLDELRAAGVRVAIWGGTGKGAAFIHQYGADADRFPLVVDSDAEKAGTFVPGSGQPIRHCDVLKDQAAHTIIIPTQWRALDIVGEMERKGIAYQRVLIEHNGRLVDFHGENHPYKDAMR